MNLSQPAAASREAERPSGVTLAEAPPSRCLSSSHREGGLAAFDEMARQKMLE